MTAATLKWIAMLTMLVDHFGVIFLEPFTGSESLGFSSPALTFYTITRLIGRLAYPLFAFLIVEGFIHTHDKKRYIKRMFLFALLTELPFDWAFGYRRLLTYQNVLWTYVLALLALYSLETLPRQFAYPLAALAAIFAELARTDYGAYGVIFIILLYLTRTNKAANTAVMAGMGILQFTAPLSAMLTHHYNGQKGAQPKWLFYAFYPGHLVLLKFLFLLMYPRP